MTRQLTVSNHSKLLDISLWLALTVLTISIWFSILSKVFFDSDNNCLISNNVYIQEIARPKFNCSICQNLTEFPAAYNLSREQFLKHYAYTRRPVIVKSTIDDWNAMKTFNYQWFQNLYNSYEGAYEVQEEEGQFFPYKTEFESLEEALNMKKNRMNERWYFGWNNVHSDIGNILRKMYKRPTFLPENSESSSIDWIFMGTPGGGAHVHLDYVNRPSWQAQITGTKTWYLYPVPECESICHPINATLSPGDIIVVDTNQWYHSTFTLPGNESITIGSEFD